MEYNNLIIDSKIYQDYSTSLDKTDLDFVDDELTRYTIEEYLNRQLEFLDCTRIFPGGLRIIQTISYVYRANISKFFYVLNMLDDINEIEEYIYKLTILHNNNIEFENINPPIIYEDKKKSKTNKTNKLPRKKVDDNKIITPKLTKEQLLTLKVNQLGGVSFKLNTKQ